MTFAAPKQNQEQSDLFTEIEDMYASRPQSKYNSVDDKKKPDDKYISESSDEDRSYKKWRNILKHFLDIFI